MCGIFSYYGIRTSAGDLVMEGLKRLEYRGYDSWGIAYGVGGMLHIHKEVGKIDQHEVFQESQMAIGHNRWATHGGVTVANAHPHLDCKSKIAVVHNGIIENYHELKEELEKRGHVFKSQTDSEVFAHLIEEKMELGFLKAVQDAFGRVDGRNAFVVLDVAEGEIMGVRSGSPLVIGVGEGEYFIASDIPAFLPYTKKVIYLNDYEGVLFKKSGAEFWNVRSSERFEPKIETVTWDAEQAEKGDYPHFMIKEIMEQPEIMRMAAAQDKEQILHLAEEIKHSYGSYLTGCGTASYAALYGAYIFSSIAKRHVNWIAGSEFGTCEHFLTEKSLVIAVSQSGETTDIMMAVESARKKNARVAAIVNVMGSSLVRQADFAIMTHAGPEIAVVSTKAFTGQLAVLFLLTYAMNGRFEIGKQLLIDCAEQLKLMLSDGFLKKLAEVADKLVAAQHIYIIGKGQNYPIALEAALKIKEASYIHAEGFAAGELKHGVIALIEEGTPCIALFSNDEDKQYILGSTMELKARGAFTIGIGPEVHEVFDLFIQVPDLPETGALINAPVVQMLAYYLSVKRGINPDRPRNLAKSVTVK